MYLESTLRGFFSGFIIAQFVSSFVAVPIIVIGLLSYLFIGDTIRTVGDKISERFPLLGPWIGIVKNYIQTKNKTLDTTTSDFPFGQQQQQQTFSWPNQTPFNV